MATKQIDLFGNEIIELNKRSIVTARQKDYIHDLNEKAERRFYASTLTFGKKKRDGMGEGDTGEGQDGTDVNENVIEGYAAVFNKDSQDFGGWIERIAPGAFDGTLKDTDTVALFNHHCNLVLGRNMTNVDLSVDDVGLKYVINLPTTTLASDIRALVKAGIITKSSFAFTVSEETFTKGDPAMGNPHVRTITKIEKLYDVSPVTTPAYPDTDVAARSLKKIEGMKEINRAIEAQKYRMKRRRHEINYNQIFNF